MYRFYAEVAGADVRELGYRRRTSPSRSRNCSPRSRPRTRAILIANPNNPTGTAIGLDDDRAHPRSAPRNAAVLIDEAYFEFCGVTALPPDRPNTRISSSAARSRRSTAWRPCARLPVLASRQRRVSAQGAVALQREHAGRHRRCRAAVEDRDYVAAIRRRSARRARAALRGLRQPRHRLLPQRRPTSCCSTPAPALDRNPRRAARPRRPGPRPQLRNRRLRPRHRRHPRADARASSPRFDEIWPT